MESAMTNFTKYRLTLVPSDGPTIEDETQQEWRLGYTFKVLFSSFLAFRTNSFITISDVDTQCRYHGAKFDVSFQTLKDSDKVVTTGWFHEAELIKDPVNTNDLDALVQQLAAKWSK
jgi:hypothetical protein